MAYLRAITADLIGYTHGVDSREVAKRVYPGESAIPQWLTRGTTSPATVTQSTWAEQFSQTSIGDFLFSVNAPTAGATLLKRGLQVDLGRNTGLKIPYVVAAKTSANFILETAPLPVYSYSLGAGVTLGLKKFGVLVAFSREVFEHSVPSIEGVVRDQVAQALALQLDALLFDANAATDIRPAGLLNGAAVALASTAAAAGVEAIKEDCAKLHAAVAPLASGQQTILVASPGQYARLVDAGIQSSLLLESSALAAKTVYAFAPPCVVSASGAPSYRISTETTLHMAAPASEVVADDTTAADPIRGLWQSDSIALRLIWRLDWALRATGGVASITAASWGPQS
jgi:hypothetical protein